MFDFWDARFRWDWRGAPDRQCYGRRRAWLGPLVIDFCVSPDPRGGKRKHGARWRLIVRDGGAETTRAVGRARDARTAWRHALQAARDEAGRLYGHGRAP